MIKRAIFFVLALGAMAMPQDKPEPCRVENTILYFPEPKCHDDENMKTDPRGGMKCVKKTEYIEYNARTCIKDFKVSDSTTLVVPLYSNGEPNFSGAKLAGFDFKNICPVIKNPQ